MKKVITGMAIGLAVLMLAACGNQTKSSSENSSNSSSSQVAQSTSSNSSSSMSSSMTAGSSSTETNVDNKTVGVFVALLADPDWFKDGVNNDGMYYGDDAASFDLGKNLAGYSFVTANGDPTSYIYYKVNGDNVTYKQWVPGEDSVADGHMETKNISLSRLENDYYVNQDQKNEVNGYASQLKSEADYISSMKNDDN